MPICRSCQAEFTKVPNLGVPLPLGTDPPGGAPVPRLPVQGEALRRGHRQLPAWRFTEMGELTMENG